jgi:hypothetical protein
MWDILRNLHVRCEIFFVIYTQDVGYSPLRTHTGSGTFLTTYSLAVAHYSPHTQTVGILHYTHTGCRTFTTHPPNNHHTRTPVDIKPIDIQSDLEGMVNILGHDKVVIMKKLFT